MYFNHQTGKFDIQNTPEQLSPEHQKMVELAAELQQRTGKAWAYVPAKVAPTVDCGSMRIEFNPTNAIRDKGRHNTTGYIFDRLNNSHQEAQFFGPAANTQVKLTKSASAIANQLERTRFLEQLQANTERMEHHNQRIEQEKQLSWMTLLNMQNVAARLLSLTPGVGIWNHKLTGTIGQVDIEAETQRGRPNRVNLKLTGLSQTSAEQVLLTLRQFEELADDQAED